MAMKTFNQLPNELKTLGIGRRSTTYKLKKWVDITKNELNIH